MVHLMVLLGIAANEQQTSHNEETKLLEDLILLQYSCFNTQIFLINILYENINFMMIRLCSKCFYTKGS